MRISQRAKPACGVFDLQQPQDHIDQYDNGEAQGAVQAGRDLLKHAKKPTYVEMFCPHPGQNYAVAFQPIGELRVMGLKARRVTNDVPADPRETPCVIIDPNAVKIRIIASTRVSTDHDPPEQHPELLHYRTDLRDLGAAGGRRRRTQDSRAEKCA